MISFDPRISHGVISYNPKILDGLRVKLPILKHLFQYELYGNFLNFDSFKAIVMYKGSRIVNIPKKKI